MMSAMQKMRPPDEIGATLRATSPTFGATAPTIIGLIFLVAVPRRRRIRKEMERIANDE
ncbi:MAG: hypothetical protein ACI9U2_003355 [Bradymonadia bacterium]|jgi:hypothetical protein